MIDIRQLIESRVASDPRLKSVLKKIEAGSATLKDTAYFTEIYSNITGNAFGSNVLDLTDEEREAACMEILRGNYEEINDICSQVQTSIDKAAGIHIKPQKAAFPLERVEQIAHSLIDPTVKDSVIKRRANTGVANVSKSFHDDYIKVNAKFRKNAGLAVYLNRETDGNCCEWCSNMAGRYSYGSEPDDIYRRHDNCGCTVTYEDGKHRQDVWSKRTWTALEAGVGAPPPTRFTKNQAVSLEHENMRHRGLEGERSKLKSSTPQTIVSNVMVNSPDYRKQYNQIEDTPQTIRAIFQNSKKALIHRSGTTYEDLIFVDSANGKVLKRTDYDESGRVKPSSKMFKMLKDNEDYTIVAIHNHPNSVLPSIDDINAARDRKYKYGIIACHNGNVYQYKIIDEKYNEEYIDLTLDNIQTVLYNKDELGDKFDAKMQHGLTSLRKFGLDMKVILWE